jgi:uncharacterized membrane protein YtjA (UPF0391 family)
VLLQVPMRRRLEIGTSPKENIMIYWAAVFLVIALIAGLFGFAGIAGTAANIAWILFVIGLVLALVFFVLGRRPPPI